MITGLDDPIVRAIVDLEHGSPRYRLRNQFRKIIASWSFDLMDNQGGAPSVLPPGEDDVNPIPSTIAGGKADPVAGADVLGAELLGIKGRPRIAVLVHHSVAALVFGADPEHLGIHLSSHELQQGGDIENSAEDRIIEPRSNWLRVVGMAVQLTADVEHTASLDHLADEASTVLVFANQSHQQSAMGGAVGGA